MDDKGSKKVKIEGLGDKRQITATFAGAMNGEFLPMQILYQGKTERVHPKFKFPDNFDVWHTPNHWANQETTVRYISNIIIPYVNRTRESKKLPNQPALALFDAFTGHGGEEIDDLLEQNSIFAVKVPASCTDELQPMDLSVNKSCKSSLRHNFSTWYAEKVAEEINSGTSPENVKINMEMQLMREVGAKWLTEFFNSVNSNKDLVVNGFKKAGIIDAIRDTNASGTTQCDAESAPAADDEDPFGSDCD